MYRLHYYPGNASLAPHVVLRECGVRFDLVLVDREAGRQHSADYLRINPLGRIPALETGSGILTEAAAICLHLADVHREAGLAPPPGDPSRAQLYQWLMFLTNTLQPELMLYHYPERHTTRADHAGEVKEKAAGILAGRLDHLDRHLEGRTSLLGGDAGICDIYMLMLCRWCRTLEPPPRGRPHLRRVLEAVASRPAVTEAFSTEGLAPPHF